MADVIPVRMPKWGLSMQEGTIVHWWKEEGSTIAAGEDLVDIETPKITNVFESPQPGVLRRVVAKVGETLPVGALLGVLAAPEVSDTEIDAFVADFQSKFVPGEDEGEGTGGLAISNIEAAGRTIRVGHAGQGSETPAVLIHGYSGDINNWLFNLEAIAAQRPVIALDLPGHGGSSKDVGEGSLAALAQAVADSLRALDIDRAHLVGHSLGGAVVARLAADRPALAASLTLICPSSLPGTQVSEEFLTGIAHGMRARDLKPWLEMLFADPSLVTKDMVEEMVKYKRIDGVEEALIRIRDHLLDNKDRDALLADLGKIARAAIIASRSDRIVGAPDVSALPGSFTIHWMNDAGHMPHLEKAAEVNAILADAMK